MNPTSLLLFSLLVLLAIVALARMRAAATEPETPAMPRPMQRAPRPPASRARPGSATAHAAARGAAVDWDVTAPRQAGAPDSPAPAGVDRSAHLRDRYIAARFPGLFRGVSDLLATDYVIKVARHLLEEDNFERAHELFALAIPASPDKLALRLAELEIAFLARDRDRFTTLAASLRAAHPEASEWTAVVRLGNALAPDHELFATVPAGNARPQFGPWPEMPNWIQASWDLTHEVLAAEFHRAIRAHAARDNHPAARRAA